VKTRHVSNSNSGNSKILFSHLGFTSVDFQNVYGNFFQTNYKLLAFISKYFNLFDYIIFLFATIKYNFVMRDITVSEWMNQSDLSMSAKYLKEYEDLEHNIFT